MNQEGVGGRSLEAAKALALTDLLKRVVLLERRVFGDGVEAGGSAAEPVNEGGEIVFVPKEISLYSMPYFKGDKAHVLLLNRQGFALKVDGSQGFGFDFYGGRKVSDNTGKNYFLRLVDEPEMGEVYFCEGEGPGGKGRLANYRLFLDGGVSCNFVEDAEPWGVTTLVMEFARYFEVVPLG